ncbi:hypothetical protein AYK24_02815 [Thermoplasmatales archaeon SG8-52-4]|nr:MAG: hypothetical protein AYK24_02815 [Thermoplasmatales archaeon SG8-52-4]
MAKWKLFSKSKTKDDKISDSKESEKEIIEKKDESEDTVVETEVISDEEKRDDQPLAEYSETLETGVPTSKKGKSTKSTKQRLWRDFDLIEEKIDNLHISRAQKPITEIDKKVDSIVSKVKVKKDQKPRKPSNVIYVVSSPQAGEVRGDWAVRGHGKFYSHHKTKEKAIEEARKIAKKRDATVMVQNTDGTFSTGFKPR